MKILHINSYFFTNEIHKNFITKLDEKGYENICLVPVEKRNPNFSFPIGFNSSVEPEKIFNRFDKFLIVSKMLKIKKVVEKRVDSEKFDMIYAHTLFTNGYAALKAKEKIGINYIVAIRNTDINIFFKKIFFLRKLGIKILKNAKQIIFISENLKNKFFNNYVSKKDYELLESKSVVIPNGLDDYWLENKILKKRYFCDDKINLLFIGSLDDNKDALGLAHAIKNFNLDKQVILRIVGDGKNKTKIETLAKKFQDKIIYLGKIKKKHDLKSIFNKTDIFIMVSKHETLGMVYLEALSQGIPVIFTKNEGIVGMITKDFAYSINYKDYPELLKKIEILSEKLSLLEDYTNKSIDLKKFSWTEILEIYEKIFKNHFKEEV